MKKIILMLACSALAACAEVPNSSNGAIDDKATLETYEGSVALYVDPNSRCQYLVALASDTMIPRLNGNGKPFCEGQAGTQPSNE